MTDTPSPDEIKKLAERGQKFLEKRRRNASRYRMKLKEEGIDSTILRIERNTLDKIRVLAGINEETLNGMIVRMVAQGFYWQRDILERYVRGEIPQDVAVGILGLKSPSSLPRLLAMEGLPIPLSPPS